MKSKLDYYKEVFALLLVREIPNKILNNYIFDIGEDAYQDLADFVINNMKESISWSTAIGIIEAVDHIYNEAVSNGNI